MTDQLYEAHELKLFLSSLGGIYVPMAIKSGSTCWLESYAFLRDDPDEVDRLRALRKKHGLTLMLDCGAFTVMTKGITITREDFLHFCQKNHDMFDIIIGLDVMNHPEETFDNCKFFQSEGIDPMACFHIGEDFSWVQKFVDNFEYLGIGGIAAKPIATTELDRFFSDFFRYIVDDKGLPIRKLHALGIARWKLFEKFPFYSTDSTIWMEGFRTATVFSEEFGPLLMTDRDENMGKSKNSFLRLDKVQQGRELDRWRAKGFTYEQLRTDRDARTAWNIDYLVNFVKKFKGVKYRDNRTLLFGRENEVLWGNEVPSAKKLV